MKEQKKDFKVKFSAKQLEEWEVAVQLWEESGKEGKKPAKLRKLLELETLKQEEISELPNLAKTWIWLHLDGVCKVLSGHAFKSKDFCESGVPVIKIANISYGEFVIKTQQYLPESFLGSSKDFVIYPDDLLIALTRPITNNKTKVCEYPEDSPLALLNQRVAALKDLTIHKEYLLFFANSKQFKESIRSKFSETLQPNLSPKDLSETPVPLCSLPEQQEIVRLLDEQFTAIEQNEKEIDHSLTKSQALRQSILKKAFAGKLIS
jgi:type I restriction enzyme S subunit